MYKKITLSAPNFIVRSSFKNEIFMNVEVLIRDFMAIYGKNF
jgi:hypothetical protein